MSKTVEAYAGTGVAQAGAGARAVPGSLAGVLNLALVLVAAQVCWYVFFSPNGLVRLYTPNMGLALVVTILMVVHWVVDAFEYWPLAPEDEARPGPGRGLAVSAACVGLGVLIMFGFYYNFIGRLGPIFFSAPKLIESGELGMYALTAQENACFAQTTMNTCIIFFTMLWLTAFGGAPWDKAGRAAKGLGSSALGLALGAVAFSCLFFPHFAFQVFPAQVFMAVEPWWIDEAMTMSSLYHFGWMVPALVLVYWTELLWEGLPWSLIPNRALRGLAMIAGVVVLGYVLMHVGNSIMDGYWDLEAFEGGSTVESPAWRWNHVAEMAMFMHAAAVILALYFGNGPKLGNVWLRAVVRTAVAVAGGLGLAWLYYELGPVLLGTVPGVGQEGDTSLCWTVMLLILMTMQQRFMGGFPFGGKRG